MKSKIQAVLTFLTATLATQLCFAGGGMHPEVAEHGMVASIHELASRAGVEMMRAGGNAVDAAVATGFALAVVHPSAGNLGGGGFMLIRKKEGESPANPWATHFIDFRETAPGKATANMYQDAQGNVIPRMSTVGYKAVGVPGSVKGLVYAEQHFGKLGLKRVIEPAIRLARDGYALSWSDAVGMTQNPELAQFPDSKRIFQNGGKGWRQNDVFRQPELARTLERISTAPDDFYTGKMAHELAELIQKGGGLITAEDLAHYEVKDRKAVQGTYRGLEVISAPPPSSGGIALLEILNILEGYDLGKSGLDSAESIHLITEAYRRAFFDRAQFLGDPEFNDLPVLQLTDKSYAKAWRNSIQPQEASSSASLTRPPLSSALEHYAAAHPVKGAARESTQTTHYSVVDADGNAVAVTTTLNAGFGSKVTVGPLGFLLNDEMDDFSSKPGSPNMFGLIQGDENAIGPGKRPLSAMTPTIVLKDGKLWLVLGSPGGPTIITTVANILIGVEDYGLDIQQAVDSPRFHEQWMPATDGAQSLLARHHRPVEGARQQHRLGQCRRRRVHRDRPRERPAAGRQRLAQRYRQSGRLLTREARSTAAAPQPSSLMLPDDLRRIGRVIRCAVSFSAQIDSEQRHYGTRTMANETFPIDLGKLQPLKLDPAVSTLTDVQKAALKHNIQLCRDVIVFFTALAGAKGLSGHTGGAYDTVPEVTIIRAFIANGTPIIPIFYDEAGHRVATQYLLSVLNGAMPAERLLHYREFDSGLPGHPEKALTPGVEFASGRLGHMWAFCNGVAMANPGKAVILLGSDGSQMEGDNAEAARLAVAKQLNVKVLVDDNNVTIAGHPQEYMPGYDLTRTLAGYGLQTETTMGEDIDALYVDLCRVFSDQRPHGLVVKRPMAAGIPGAEGSPKAHEVLEAETAVHYLEKRGGYEQAIEMLKAAKPSKSPLTFKGSSGAGKNRDDFGKIINEILDGMSEADRVAKVRVFDNDLEGSQGLHHVRKKHPEVFIRGGIMERGNYSAASGFGAVPGKQGIYATFSAFLEMCISEITMARLNFSNVLAHFSHSGVDDMADNTCHFGINSMFADGGVTPVHGGDTTRLYFPADQHQFAACVKRIFNDPGLRFVFSTRAAVPDILGDDGKPLYQGKPFEPGKDHIVRTAPAGGGYVVATGETVYRALDAVIRLQEQGVKVGLINKSTLNTVDAQMMKTLSTAPFVLVAEGWNVKTGLGSRFGSYLLQAGFKGSYNHIGTNREGSGGLWQQMGHQGLDSDGIAKSIRALL